MAFGVVDACMQLHSKVYCNTPLGGSKLLNECMNERDIHMHGFAMWIALWSGASIWAWSWLCVIFLFVTKMHAFSGCVNRIARHYYSLSQMYACLQIGHMTAYEFCELHKLILCHYVASYSFAKITIMPPNIQSWNITQTFISHSQLMHIHTRTHTH